MQLLYYTVSQKNFHLFIFQITQKLTDFTIFGVLNNEKIRHQKLIHLPPYLYSVTTLPWEIKKVIFQQYYSYRLQIITLCQKKQTATVVLQLICLLTIVYCFLLSVQPCSMVSFLSLWSVIFRATNAGFFQSHQHLEERNITCSQM